MKVMPHDYKRVLRELAERRGAGGGGGRQRRAGRRSGRWTRSAGPAPDGQARRLPADRASRHPPAGPAERVHDYHEFLLQRPVAELRDQGARCMDCGVPFCHNGCPLGNLIPDWNDLVYRDRFEDAIAQLHATNNFPEFTGRLCPAPCEAACVLEIREGDAVTIKQIENSIINRAWEEGWVRPQPPRRDAKPGRRWRSSGSGPAGMAAAQQLRRAGHRVTLFERDEAIGGLVRFGVPDFKIEKAVVQRRVEQLVAEGVELRCGVDVGTDVSVEELRERFDAVVLATGSRVPRDLPVPGRELDGVHFAMDYLYQRNRWVARELGPAPHRRAARDRARDHAPRGKDVVVIGGGDTGADCVGNALREGARSIVQLELLPEPPAQRPDEPHPVAAVAAEVPPQLRDGGGQARPGGAGLLGDDDAFLDDGRGACAALRIARGRRPSRRSRRSRAPSASCPPSWCCSRWASCGPEQELLDQLGVERDARGNVRRSALHDLSGRRVRRGRRPPRPVADRVGDQRGAPVRAHGRPLSRAAARRRGRPAARLARGRRPGRPRRRGRGPRGPAAARSPGIGAG